MHVADRMQDDDVTVVSQDSREEFIKLDDNFRGAILVVATDDHSFVILPCLG